MAAICCGLIAIADGIPAGVCADDGAFEGGASDPAAGRAESSGCSVFAAGVGVACGTAAGDFSATLGVTGFGAAAFFFCVADTMARSTAELAP